MNKPVSREGLSTGPRILLILGVAFAALLLLSVFLFYVIPVKTVMDRAGASLGEAGLEISAGAFERALPFTYEGEGVVVSALDGREIVYLDTFYGGVSPAGLARGRVFDFGGTIGTGELSGFVRAGWGWRELKVEASSIDLKSIPLLDKKGVSLGGVLSGSLAVVKPAAGCPSGRIIFKGEGGEDIRLAGVPLPVGRAGKMAGEIVLESCEARIERLWLDGEDFSVNAKGRVRLTGQIASSPLEATLELVPKAGLLEKPFLLGLLAPYRKSANFYSVRIGGTLGAPVAVP